MRPQTKPAGVFFSCDSVAYFLKIFHISLHTYTIYGLNE
jgi:hypothetical protein